MFLLYTHKIHHSAKKKANHVYLLSFPWVFVWFLYGFTTTLHKISPGTSRTSLVPPSPAQNFGADWEVSPGRRLNTLVAIEPLGRPVTNGMEWNMKIWMGYLQIYIYIYIYIMIHIYIYIQIVVTIIPFWDINGILQYEWWFNQPKYCRGGYCNSWWNNEVQLIILVISYNHRYIGNIHMNGI